MIPGLTLSIFLLTVFLTRHLTLDPSCQFKKKKKIIKDKMNWKYTQVFIVEYLNTP